MKFFILVFSLLFLCVTCRYHDRFRSDVLRVTYFDVGQGDAALVRFPGGQVWMIDSGGGFQQWDMGRRELLLELTRMGVLKIDAAILSHPDEDHAMGFRGLFEQIEVNHWLYHRNLDTPAFSRPVMRELKFIAQNRSIPRSPLGGSLKGDDHGVHWELFPLSSHSLLTNDQALIVALQYGKCHFLFTGDIETAGERALENVFQNRIEFLKVAHHGSKTSSSWSLLEKWRPFIAIVSAGVDNRYGHPHPQIVQRFMVLGSRLLRTDFHGYVEIEVSKEGNFRCSSFKGSCGNGRCATSETRN